MLEKPSSIFYYAVSSIDLTLDLCRIQSSQRGYLSLAFWLFELELLRHRRQYGCQICQKLNSSGNHWEKTSSSIFIDRHKNKVKFQVICLELSSSCFERIRKIHIFFLSSFYNSWCEIQARTYVYRLFPLASFLFLWEHP